MDLPVDYTKLAGWKRRVVREEYVKRQNGKCMFCHEPLDGQPPKEITDQPIDWTLFKSKAFFLRYPVHLQHNHDTGMTEGAVHAHCNAYMWQYEGR